MKKSLIFVLSLLAAFGIAAFVMVFLTDLISPKPPKESELIKNFYANRVAYERLRDMLQADKQVVRLASWGVETTNSVVTCVPPVANFSVERYNEYMALLKQVGGLAASRHEGENADPSILVWGRGWAGKTRHIGICWHEQEPTNQVTSLDSYRSRRDGGERQVVYRHIDEKWYFWTDLLKFPRFWTGN